MGKTRYPSKSWVFKSRFSFKVRQHCQQQICLQYKVCWILYKLVASTIFTKKPSLYFSQFSPPYSTATCSQNHPYKLHWHSLSPYPGNFSPPFFCVQPSQNLHQQYFPTSILLPIQAALKHQGPREPCEDWHNFNLSLLPQSMDSNNRVKNHSFFIVKILKSCVLQVQQTIQSSFSHSLNLLSLLPYPNNTTARTNVLLQTSCLTWFSS